MPKLSIFFTGICGFLEDFSRALLVNAPHATVLTLPPDVKRVAQPPIAIPGHSAYVRVPSDAVNKIDGPQTPVQHRWNTQGRFPLATDRVDTSILFLDHHEVVLPPSTDVLKPNLAPRGIPPVSTEPSSLNWVVDMAELGANATISPDLLDDFDPGDRVAAFVRFKSGTLMSRAVGFEFNAVGLDSLTTPVGSLNRPVAQLIQCDVNVPDPVVVKCRYYGKTPSSASLGITFKPGIQNPWLVVGLSALEDILQLSTIDHGDGTPAPDYHFSLLYGLTGNMSVAGLIANSQIVLPLGRTPAGTRELGAPKCVPLKAPTT